MSLKLSVIPTSSIEDAMTNSVFVSKNNFKLLLGSSNPAEPVLALLRYGNFQELVYRVRPDEKITDLNIALNGQQREFLRLQLDSFIDVTSFAKASVSKPELYSNVSLTVLNFRISLLKKASTANGTPKRLIDCDELSSEVHRCFSRQMFVPGMKIAHKFQGSIPVQLQVEDGNEKGFLTSDTSLLFSKDRNESGLTLSGAKSIVSSAGVASARQMVGVDFEKLGIGGLDEEFTQIFRRAFASRVYPADIVRKLGTKHVRGLMLYGPPGCGKTLIARQLSRVLQGEREDGNFPEPKVVSGPEILNKYVGGSEEKVRELFKEAEVDEQAMGEDSPLHVIILDEIDAICRRRGSSKDSTGVGDSVVNQLLAKIDGVNSLNNVLLIGMTNRLDTIDPALLRPGRFEVHIEIGLPNEQGRLQILRIHTSKMRDNDVLGTDVELDNLAKQTKNFSGAEIEGLVKSAASFAYLRHVNESKQSTGPKELKVTHSDFDLALKEVIPAFGVHREDELEVYYRNGVLMFNDSVKIIRDTVLNLAHQVEHSKNTPSLSVLLSGETGSGKSAFSASLAADSGFPFVKFVSPDGFIGLTEQAKCSMLVSVFEDAFKSPLSLIVLDDIERIIDYVSLGPRFSNTVLQALLVLINKPPPKSTRKVFILATTAIPHAIQELGLFSVFNVKLSLPLLTTSEEILFVIEKVLDHEISNVDAHQIAKEIRKPTAMKPLLVVLEMARQKALDEAAGKVTYSIFMECLHNVGF